MALSKTQGIAFDLDGTLTDSAPDLAWAVNAMLTDFDRNGFSEKRVRGWIGNGMLVLIKRALSGDIEIDPTLPSELVEQALSCFGEHYLYIMGQHSSLYPGVMSSLEALKQADIKLAVITNKAERYTPPLLKKLGLDKFFDVVICGDTLPEKKPSPVPLIECAQRLGIPVASMLMVGDSKNDIVAAKAAGCPSVGLTYGYNYGEDIALSKPGLVCDHFPAILGPLGLEFAC